MLEKPNSFVSLLEKRLTVVQFLSQFAQFMEITSRFSPAQPLIQIGAIINQLGLFGEQIVSVLVNPTILHVLTGMVIPLVPIHWEWQLMKQLHFMLRLLSPPSLFHWILPLWWLLVTMFPKKILILLKQGIWKCSVLKMGKQLIWWQQRSNRF